MEGHQPLTQLRKSGSKVGFHSQTPHLPVSDQRAEQTHLSSNAENFLVTSLIIGLIGISVLTSGATLYLTMKLNLFPGPAIISFDDSGRLLFRDTVSFDRIHLTQNTISGLEYISGAVDFESQTSRLSVNDDQIEIASPNGFHVVSPDTGDKIFPANLSAVSLPSSLASLTVTNVAKEVKRVRSPIGSELEIKASQLKVRGNQGFHAEGKISALTAAENIVLTSLNGSIVLDTHEGIFLQGLKKEFSASQVTNVEGDLQYKLCICGKSGRIFKLHLLSPETTCADVRFPESANPCL